MEMRKMLANYHAELIGFEKTAMSSGVPSVAGRSTFMPDEGTDKCLKIRDRPSTPDHVRHFRKSYYAEPGMRVIHPGLINDVKDMDTNRKYGVTTIDSEHVDDVFSHGPQTEYSEYNNSKKEAIYRSVKREPLGKGYNRGYDLPQEVKKDNFSFGLLTGSSESAKNLMYPRVDHDDDIDHAQYSKSHGSFAPGEQRQRNYDWKKYGVKLDSHRFGKSSNILPFNGVSSGVSAVLKPETQDSMRPRRIAAKQTEDLKDTYDQLGKVKNLGTGQTRLPSNFAFGLQGSCDEWDARACIAGAYSQAEQGADADLGKSITPGWRNQSDQERAFGVPTVRSDIPKYERNSLADNQNYGDDVQAVELLYPSRTAYMGVKDSDFVASRSQKDIRDIFHNIGYTFDDDTFQRLWNRAASESNLNTSGEVSVEEFRAAVNELEEARSEGYMDAWRQKTGYSGM